MDNKYKLIELLNSMRTQHRYCEDCWYSCPAHPEYSGPSGECDCWLKEHNEEIDKAIQLVHLI